MQQYTSLGSIPGTCLLKQKPIQTIWSLVLSRYDYDTSSCSRSPMPLSLPNYCPAFLFLASSVCLWLLLAWGLTAIPVPLMGAPAPSPARRKRDKCLVKQKDTKTTLKKSLHHSTVPKWKGNPKSENKRGPKWGIGFSAAKWVGFLHQGHGFRRQRVPFLALWWSKFSASESKTENASPGYLNSALFLACPPF